MNFWIFHNIYGHIHIYHGVPKFICFLALRLSPCYAVSVGSLFNKEELAEDFDDVSDGQRLSWIAGMGRSTLWLHERVLAKMLGFDSSTDEGMGEFKKFIKIVGQGSTGRRGRPSWVPTLEPCNGVQIDMGLYVDNILFICIRE